MHKRRIEGLDEEKLFGEVQEAGEKLIEKSGSKLKTRLPEVRSQR